MSKLIKIGTLLNGPDAAALIPKFGPYGFECFGITFWQTTGGIDLAELAKRVVDLAGQHGAFISSLGIFGNPLTGAGDNADTLASWERLIDHAHLFGTDIVSGFTGRIPDRPIEESIPRFKEVFGRLAERARDRGVRLAFENCSMGGSWYRGDWNIAHNPDAWNLMFDALPVDNIGLQWEPCHQLLNLIDPIPQLREWAPRIFNIHGKDANVAWDIVRKQGVNGVRRFSWDRTPGFGDTDWTEIITILHQSGYQGTIDIEGWHDPVYCGELELTGQVASLEYLKRCRGGSFVPMPKLEGGAAQ